MPAPSYTIASSVGTFIKNVDPTLAPTSISVSFSTATTTATFSLDFTLHDSQYLSAIGSTIAVVWFPDTTLVSSNTPRTTSYTFPIAGVRLNLTAVSSGAVTLAVLQEVT